MGRVSFDSNVVDKPTNKVTKRARKSTFGTDVQPHPYGAKPSGNIFLASKMAIKSRSQGLGLMSNLEDDSVLGILSMVPATTLCSFATCSRWLYTLAHHDHLWRELTLSAAIKAKIGVSFTHSWKDTFAQMYCRNKDADSAAVTPHTPMQMDGIFSDALYRPWHCRACDIKPKWLAGDNVERRSGLSVQDFVKEFEQPNIPVIITDIACKWEAFKRWDQDYLIRECGDKRFRATSVAASQACNFTMAEYFTYANAVREEAPMYLFERDFSKMVPQLGKDYEVPKYFTYGGSGTQPAAASAQPSSGHCSDLFHVLGAGRRPDHKWLIAGPARSGSVFHIDPNATNAWNAAIRGRKKWILYPPNSVPPGVFPADDLGDVVLPLSLSEWYLNFFDEHAQARTSRPPAARPLECIVQPGEVIFVPHGWWHSVFNLDDSIALTQNYVSPSNLFDVLQFLQHKKEQISGVNDRSEAISPDILHDEFKQRLREVHPSIVAKLEKEKAANNAKRNCFWTQLTKSSTNTEPKEDGSEQRGAGTTAPCNPNDKQQSPFQFGFAFGNE